MAKRPRDEVEREIMDIIPERFDSDSESEGARRGSRTRIVFSIALGLLVIAVVGVAARHLLVGEGVPVVAESTLPVVRPDDKPIKTKPEDRGGMDVPNQDKLVLQDMGKGDATAPANEKLLPAPEKPQPLAKPAPASNSGSGGAMPPAASADSNSPPPAVAPSATPVAPAQPVQQADAAPKPVASAPMSAAAPADAKKDTAAPATKMAANAPAPAPVPKAGEVKKPEAAPAAATPAPKPAASGAGGWQVQLAAMRSEAEADAIWKKTSAANKDLLGNLTEDIQKADLGAKGIYYRLRAGPLDEAAAKSLCAELVKRNQVCIVARK